MQFKHPELLWALLLLLIPIFIHLFQLRRFKKTPFTNVKFLQKVVSKSRRSNTLKKWLLLFTRMLLLAGMIIAFAQPFFAKKSALMAKETVIYLDDSFSMQARSENATLLDDAVQNLLTAIPEDQKFTLFTNKRTFEDVTLKSVQNDLLSLQTTDKQLKTEEVYLKASTLFSAEKNTIKNLVLISDFQERMGLIKSDTTNTLKTHLVRMSSENQDNVSIDSIYAKTSTTENIDFTALLSTNGELESIPVSLFNDEKLIAKTSAVFTKNKKAQVDFTIPENEVINGKIEITDTGLLYDNQLFFNTDVKNKIKILAIGSSEDDYLERIFTEDEYDFGAFSLKNLNYSDINQQNIIILDELESIPNALTTSLRSYRENGGSLVIIPANQIDIPSYNQLVSDYFRTSFIQKVNSERNITNITFSHPLYRNVFEKNVVNFQYPKVSAFFRVKTNASSILSYQDKTPFLLGADGFYLFTASLDRENSNFKNSPLIVPTLYNMGRKSLKLPVLYHTLGKSEEVEIPIQLPKDHILKISKEEMTFIPAQKSFANKVALSFFENPVEAGIYAVTDKETIHKNISFNFQRAESTLDYLDLDLLEANTKNESINSLFQQMEIDNTVNELWKWFVILAVLFMIVEVLIQKYL